MSELDVVIGPEEPRFWLAIGCCVSIALFLIWGVHRNTAQRERHLRYIGFAMLGMQVLDLTLALGNPDLSFSIHRSLPLHFCGLNTILLGILCFRRSPVVFAFAGFMGMIGGFHSLITPQLPSGDAWPFFLLYYTKHAALVVVPIILARSYGFRFRRWDWLRAYGLAVLASTVMMGVNGVLNTRFPHAQGLTANYMYVWEAPTADNPLILDWGWPWYLLPLHVALLVHLILINALFRKCLSPFEKGAELKWFE